MQVGKQGAGFESSLFVSYVARFHAHCLPISVVSLRIRFLARLLSSSFASWLVCFLIVRRPSQMCFSGMDLLMTLSVGLYISLLDTIALRYDDVDCLLTSVYSYTVVIILMAVGAAFPA